MISSSQISADAQRALADQNAEILALRDRMATRWPQVIPLAEAALKNEIDLATFRDRAFQLSCNPQPMNLGLTAADFSAKERQQFRMFDLIRTASGEVKDSFIREVSNEQLKRTGMTQRAPNSVVLPHDVLWGMQHRDQLVATGSLGGNVVATNLLASSFIEVLRNRMVTAQAGITMLHGLTGNTVIPRKSATAATAWVGETSAATEASLTFDQVTLTPKTISTYVDYSWLLLQQSTPAIDQIIRNDLVTVIGQGIDSAVLLGTGSSSQPTGIVSTSGIGSSTMGANGGFNWAGIVGLETAVTAANGSQGRGAYITNAKVRGKGKQTVKGTTATDSNFIWEAPNRAELDGILNSYPAYVSNVVSSNLTKGTSTTVCSAIYFGDWTQLLLGLWSGVELLADPYTMGVNRVIRLHAYQACDISVRHPESFAYCPDATTT